MIEFNLNDDDDDDHEFATEDHYVIYLSVEDLLYLVEAQGTTVADVGLLASAAARPQTSVAGQDAYESLQEKAAALAESICRNHPLVDGNKRLTIGAIRIFLKVNGYELDLDEDARFDLIMAIADGTLRGVPAIANRMPITPRRNPL